MSYEANIIAARRIRQLSDGTEILASTAHYEDEIIPLQDAGIDHVFNFYSDAGAGFAEHGEAF